MNLIFSDEPDKRKFIINELKEYTEQGDMNRLAASLNSVLVTSQQRSLLEEIKPFIPVKQQPLFDHLTSLHNSSTVFSKPNEIQQQQQQLLQQQTPPISITIQESINTPKQSPPILITNKKDSIAMILTEGEKLRNSQPRLSFKIAPLADPGKRRLLIKRDAKEQYGFTLKGNKPALVDSVDPNSLAQKAGLRHNDVILSINGLNVEMKNHRDVIEMMNNCETNPIIEVKIYMKLYIN